MTTPKFLTPKKNVVHTELEVGNAVLLDLETHRYYSLNQSGALIWTLISEGKTLKEIATSLAEKFSLDAIKAETDVTALADELRKAGLVTEAA